jgi:hypothetical protein
MKSLLIILLVFLFFSYTLQACIPGENCPYNQGECTDDQCSCKDGFFTIIDSEKEEINQIFCNYEQISVKMMLLLEVLLPSSGQVYCGRYIHAAIKFALVVSFILVSKFLTKKILIPKCFIVAKNALLGGGDDNKDDEKKEKKENNNDNDNEEDRLPDDEVEENSLSDCFSLKTTKDISVKFGGTSKKCQRFVFYFSRIIIYAFWTFYSVDIYLIFFKLYSDGKGIPFGD